MYVNAFTGRRASPKIKSKNQYATNMNSLNIISRRKLKWKHNMQMEEKGILQAQLLLTDLVRESRDLNHR